MENCKDKLNIIRDNISDNCKLILFYLFHFIFHFSRKMNNKRITKIITKYFNHKHSISSDVILSKFDNKMINIIFDFDKYWYYKNYCRRQDSRFKYKLQYKLGLSSINKWLVILDTEQL